VSDLANPVLLGSLTAPTDVLDVAVSAPSRIPLPVRLAWRQSTYRIRRTGSWTSTKPRPTGIPDPDVNGVPLPDDIVLIGVDDTGESMSPIAYEDLASELLEQNRYRVTIGLG